MAHLAPGEGHGLGARGRPSRKSRPSASSSSQIGRTGETIDDIVEDVLRAAPEPSSFEEGRLAEWAQWKAQHMQKTERCCRELAEACEKFLRQVADGPVIFDETRDLHRLVLAAHARLGLPVVELHDPILVAANDPAPYEGELGSAGRNSANSGPNSASGPPV